MYDIYTPLVKDVKFEMPYDEAKEWMLKALEPMGKRIFRCSERRFKSSLGRCL